MVPRWVRLPPRRAMAQLRQTNKMTQTEQERVAQDLERDRRQFYHHVVTWSIDKEYSIDKAIENAKVALAEYDKLFVDGKVKS